MDPLTAVGALASAVQLFDISLKYSSQACSFLSALKHSKEDTAVLERTLREVNAVMRNLQMYATELQRSSATSSVHHTTLRQSITYISQQFSNDMTALLDVLPRDLSISMLNRVKFVVRRSDIDKILLRLEQRKTAATMALGIIGRMDDIQLREGISSLKSRLHQMSVEHNLAFENHARLYDAANSESQQREAEIITSLQELQNMTLQNSKEGALNHCTVQTGVTTMIGLENETLSYLQRLESLVQSNTHAISLLQESQRAGLATLKSNLEAGSIDALGRLIRAELRQQLEPVLNGNIDGVKEQVDSIIMDIGNKANAEHLFGTPQSTPVPPDATYEVDESLLSERLQRNEPHRRVNSAGSKEIRLFSYEFDKTIAGAVTISIRLHTYRVRGQINIDSQTKFFQLQVDIIPRRWLCSKGFSTFYSSGPDHRGYFNICPSILPFGIISYDVLEPVLEADDLEEFRRMLQGGQLGIRDRIHTGPDLHELALWHGASSISQYLLRDSGYGEEFVEQGIAQFDLALLMGRIFPKAPPETYTSTLSLYDELLPEGRFSDISFHVGWSEFYHGFEPGSHPCVGHAISSEAVESARVLIRHGVMLRPFGWSTGRLEGGEHFLIVARLQVHVFLMKIYIATGGSPNLLDESGLAPLLIAMLEIPDALRTRARKKRSNVLEGGDDSEEGTINSGEIQGSQRIRGGEEEEEEEEDDGDGGDKSEEGDNDESVEDDSYEDEWDKKVELSIELLSVLISAGADVHHIHHGIEGGMTLARIAYLCKVQDIWEAALERCGFNTDEVVMESNRRLSEHVKLRGAMRTGVDIESVVSETGSANGLRQRARWQVEELD